MVYDVEWAAAGMIHAFFGVSWFGMSMVSEMVLAPTLTKSTKIAELAPIGRFAPRVSIAGTVLGTLTLLSGFTYLVLKFGTDVNSWFSNGITQAILGALFTTLAALVYGLAVMRPAAMALAKNRPATPPPPDADIPEPMKPKLQKVAMLSHIMTLFPVIALVFMVIALEGGF